MQGGDLQRKADFNSVESDESVNTGGVLAIDKGIPKEQTNDGLEGKSSSVSEASNVHCFD